MDLPTIETKNNTTENELVIEGNSEVITNRIRKHYLENFDLRNLNGIVDEYVKEAQWLQIVDGEKLALQGHDQIKETYGGIFSFFVIGESQLELKSIIACEETNTGMVHWSGEAPGMQYKFVTDTFTYNKEGKITSHFTVICTK